MSELRVLPPTLPFVAADLLAPMQAVVAYLAGAGLTPPSDESVPIAGAFGRVLAEPAAAREAHPAQPRSTMDGFAIATAGGGAPRRIVGDIRMGSAPPRSIAPDETLRIPTGGTLPPGADAVVPIEDAVVTGDLVTISAVPPSGDCVTQAGSDIAEGDVALFAGRRIGGPEMGVLATLGYARVLVKKRPRFAVLSTGDELIDPAARPNTGQVRDSNRYAIAGSLAARGIDAVHVPPVPDTPEALDTALRLALAGHDGVILSGGSSVGERDLVPRIVGNLGEPGVVVHGLRVKPGKPTMLGAIGGKPVLGLPGNPTSCLLILEAVLGPVLATMTGEELRPLAVVEAVAAEPFVGRAGWTWYVPALLSYDGSEARAIPLPLRSAQTSLLARASGYVVLDETTPRIEAGARVRVVRLASGGSP